MAAATAPKTAPTTTRKSPAYRQRTGYTQAIVTLTDAVTKRRKDYWLGEYGSPESRELYYRVLAEYEALGRRLPELPDAAPSAAAAKASGPAVDELALQYWRRVAREFLLEATMRHLPSPVRAMVRLQLLTGARPGEIVGLKGGDIDRETRTGLLVARLAEHKTSHLGAERDQAKVVEVVRRVG